MCNKDVEHRITEMELAKKLHELFVAGQAEVVPGASAAELGKFIPGDKCHDNVSRWLEEHPTHRAVRGWIASNDSWFDQHSIVDIGNGLLDITPRVAGLRLPFIRHPGCEDDFRCQPSYVTWIGDLGISSN
jgi:hypothetical protein